MTRGSGWKVVTWVALAGFGCQPAEDRGVEPADTSELGRDVSFGQEVIADPWPSDTALTAPLVADLDGDGWVDVVSGHKGWCTSGGNTCDVPALQSYQDSRMGLWLGGPGGFPATPNVELTTRYPVALAHASAVVGDTDGDGRVEVLVSDSKFGLDEGKVWLEEMAAVPGRPQWSLEGGLNDRLLGTAVEPLGDVNGDGYDDLMLGSPQGAQAPGVWLGAVAVFYGGPGGLGSVPDWTSGPLADSAATGLAAGDVDGDGYPDAFVGAPTAYWTAPYTDPVVFGFRGGPGGFGAAPDWVLTRPTVRGVNDAHFGYQLKVLPDLNGDGYRELAVSAPAEHEVEVFEGGPGGPAATPTWTYTANGYGLATGDVDGDGLTDLLMTDGGGAKVVLGVPGGLAPTEAYVMRGPAGESCFYGNGTSDVDAFEHAIEVADVDRDGRDDVVFACETVLGGGVYVGSIVVAYGGVDSDGDAVPDTMDCAPQDPAIYPGAEEVWYDGVDQDCDGADDFDQDGDGLYAIPWGPDEDDTEALVTLAMAVGGSCTTALDFTVDGVAPGATVDIYEGRGAVNGGSAIPAGAPCHNRVSLQLMWATYVTSGLADLSGHVQVTGVVPWADACTHDVQAVDTSTCTKSGLHSTPP